MEPLSERCYPRNYFDPYSEEPTHERCNGCREVFDLNDLEHESSGGTDFYYCQDCQEKRQRIEDLQEKMNEFILNESIFEDDHPSWGEVAEAQAVAEVKWSETEEGKELKALLEKAD